MGEKMADLKKLAEDISKLSLVDAVELKNILKDEFDFYLSMPNVGNLNKEYDRRKYLEISERKILLQDIIMRVMVKI